MNLSVRFLTIVLVLMAAKDVIAQENNSGTLEKTATVATAASQDRPQRGAFGVTYYFIGGQNFATSTQDASSFDIFDSYLSFNYKVDQDLRFAARPAFGYTVEGYNKHGDDVNSKSRVRDFSFVMTAYNVAEDYLPATIEYQIQPRVYIPTSDDSKDQGMVARLRVGQEMRWNFQKYSNLRFYLTPSYFFQRSTTYLSNSNPKKPNSLKTTAMADSEHGVELVYSLSRYFSVKPALNFVDKWSNDSAANNLERYHSSVVDYRLGFEIRADRNLSFTIGLQSEQDLINTQKPRELSYSLMTGGTLF